MAPDDEFDAKSGGDAQSGNVTLSIPLDYLTRLIVKMRAIEAREGLVDPNSGSNPTDDASLDVLQEEPGDLMRLELLRELQALNERQRAELLALTWLARGEVEPEEWERSIETAREREEDIRAGHLLRDPHFSELIEEGAEKLNVTLPWN